MPEDQSSSTRSETRAEPEHLCDNLRKAFHEAAEFLLPPESAARHFREARIEVLRGIRELIDLRINRLSRRGEKGTSVVVE